MAQTTSHIKLGARSSSLSKWQAHHVADVLQKAHPGLTVELVWVSTVGDRVRDVPLPEIGQKGVFTAELEEALRSKQIDIAIHSFKDLPIEDPADLCVGAVLPRENPCDVLVSQGLTLKSLPRNAKVGTSSVRRAAELKRFRPDIQTVNLRGNVDTRLRKALQQEDGICAIILAYAGLKRLSLTEYVSEEISTDAMLPAPAQGALAVQCCRNNHNVLEILSSIHDSKTFYTTAAERAFLQGLGGGCSLPISALATLNEGALSLQGRVIKADGTHMLEVTCEFTGTLSHQSARELGLSAAQKIIAQGARDLL